MSTPEETLNRILHAVADPTRRKILHALKERGACSIDKNVGLCASDIEARVHLSQPTISHHMSILIKAGLVQGKKLGQWCGTGATNRLCVTLHEPCGKTYNDGAIASQQSRLVPFAISGELAQSDRRLRKASPGRADFSPVDNCGSRAPVRWKK